MVDWNLYLSQYQKDRGGVFLGGNDEDCDCHLIVPDGEKSPLLVVFSTDPAGRYTVRSLRCRTMVQLSGPYHLHIRARGIVGSGVSSVANLIGKQMDFGFSETKGRIITTDNRPFTKLVLGDLALRTALQARKSDELRVLPGPQEDGWHMIEVCPANFDGWIKGDSSWSTESMNTDTSFMAEEDRAVLLHAGSTHFNAQMDAFLAFLRTARDAVTMWPMQ